MPERVSRDVEARRPDGTVEAALHLGGSLWLLAGGDDVPLREGGGQPVDEHRGHVDDARLATLAAAYNDGPRFHVNVRPVERSRLGYSETGIAAQQERTAQVGHHVA